MSQVPTVGRNVHFYRSAAAATRGEPEAAVVNGVLSGAPIRVHLTVFRYGGGIEAAQSVMFLDDATPRPKDGRSFACWPPRS